MTTFPQWTEELSPTFVTGQDQLGVDGPAVTYQQWLVPGIISTTDHARYYSFYAWVLYRFITWTDSTRLLKDFRGSFFKRHEAGLIAASYAHHLETGGIPGLVGRNAASDLWSSGDNINLDYNYFKQALGGLGQYYLSALRVMGIIDEAEEARWVYALTDRGKALAEAYQESIAGTAYLRSLDREHTLTKLRRRAADEYGKVGCICPEALEHGLDRDLLRDAFFRLGDQGGVESPHVRRRLTCALTLDLVRSRHGKFTRDQVYPALYLNEYEPGYAYSPHSSLAKWAARWRLVAAHQHYAFALQCLWSVFLLRLADVSTGITFVEYAAWVKSQLPPDRWSQPVGAFLNDIRRHYGLRGDWKRARSDFHEACRASGGQDEHSLFRAIRSGGPDPALRLESSLRLMAQQFLRFLPEHQANDSLWHEMAHLGRLPMGVYFNALLRQLDDEQWTIGQWLTWLYREYILGQHEFVALEKLRAQRYDTFKFHYRDGRFNVPSQGLGDYQERMRLSSMRLQNVLTILTDLGLIQEDDEGQISITADGRSYLNEATRRHLHDQP